MAEHRPGTHPSIAAPGPIVLFDGVCHLCSAIVQFAIPRDPRRRLRFAPLQSAISRQLLGQCADPPIPDSFVLIDRGRAYVRSAAALRIVRHLAMPWPILAVFGVVPRPVRDWAYDFVARRRYRWYGTRAVCFVPTPEIKDRFLEAP